MASIITRPELNEGVSVSLDPQGLMDIIDQEARLVGMSGREAIDRVKTGGAPVHGYIWDDISLLVSLLPE